MLLLFRTHAYTFRTYAYSWREGEIITLAFGRKKGFNR